VSTIRLVTDNGDTEDIGDVDSHFYEKQVPPNGPFGSNAFALATARAKDKARVQMIKAIRKADAEAMSTGLGLGLQGFSEGVLISTSGGETKLGLSGVVRSRTIDGVLGAPDDAIKL
jgi:hypothetical protein